MSKFLDALACKNRGRPPVWFMRQAGRALPEYRALRAQHSLYDLFHDSDRITEITLMPIKTLGVDAAIYFSDILIPLQMLGYELHYQDGKSPFVTPGTDKKELLFLEASMANLRQKLTVPLIGFAGGPYTVQTYMREKASLDTLTDLTIVWLKRQVAAGAQAIQIFDSWAASLSPTEFNTYCQMHLKKIMRALDGTPIILFCKGATTYAKELAALGPACISFDSSKPLVDMRRLIGPSIAVQGNLDSELLLGPNWEPAAHEILSSMKGDPGFIFNLGHGVLPKTPENSLKSLVQEVCR